MNDKRHYRRPVKQYVDQDYKSKLTPEERAWLLKFNDEYYDGSNLNKPDSLHSKEHSKSIYDSINSRNRDILNIGEEAFAESREPISENYPTNIVSLTYAPSDYLSSDNDPEEALVELIDLSRTKS